MRMKALSGTGVRRVFPDRAVASSTIDWRWTTISIIGLLRLATAVRAETIPAYVVPSAPMAEPVVQAQPAVLPRASAASSADPNSRPTLDIAWALEDVPVTSTQGAISLPFEAGTPQSNTQYGPPYEQPAPAEKARVFLSFGDRLETVKWETMGLAAYLTAINLPGLIKRPSDFDFEEEGLFGKNTANLGMDKVAHAFNAYVLSDVLYWRMERKTGPSAKSALASSAIAVGLDLYAELFDAFEERSGFSVSDVGFNVAGAAFSYARNTVPGLKEKVDFRLMIIPNRDFYSISNKKEHFRQERFLLALKLAGFEGLKRTPLRFIELHAGYYARGFTDRERARGDARERKPFVGIGINLKELFFPTSRATVARVARSGLDYIQIPYTAVHID